MGQDKGFVPMDVGISEAGWTRLLAHASYLKMTKKQQTTRKHTKSTAKSYSINNNNDNNKNIINKNIINNNIIINNNNTNNHNPEYIQKLQNHTKKSMSNNTIATKSTTRYIQNQQQPPTKKNPIPRKQDHTNTKTKYHNVIPPSHPKKHKNHHKGHHLPFFLKGGPPELEPNVSAVVTTSTVAEACSRTLDFAFADAACSAVATLLRKHHEASELKERSRKAGLPGGGRRWG